MTNTELLKGKYPVDCVVIRLPDFYHANFGLEMHSENTELVAGFKSIVLSEIMAGLQNADRYWLKQGQQRFLEWAATTPDPGTSALAWGESPPDPRPKKES